MPREYKIRLKGFADREPNHTKRVHEQRFVRVSPKNAKLKRMARLYIAGGTSYDGLAILHAAEQVARDIGATSFQITSVSEGSVFAAFKQFGVKFAEKRAVRRVASQAMQAAEAMTVDKAIAENVSVQATAIAALVAAGTHVDAMALDLGGLQYVQTRDEEGRIRVAARGLGSREISVARLSNETIQNPNEMYEQIKASLESGE